MLAVALGAAGCGQSGSEDITVAPSAYEYPAPPALGASAGAAGADPRVRPAWSRLVDAVDRGRVDRRGLETLVATRDARLAWLLGDLLRFVGGGPDDDAVVAAFVSLTGVDPSADPAFADSIWVSITNHLFAWELPAPQGYRELKGQLFRLTEPGWEPFFADAESEVDWRFVSWGGVGIDNRPLGDPDPCASGGIPGVDDPALTDAARGGWYPDDAVVFGLVEGGKAVALPKNIMEVHEMVNMTLGGRRLGIPYCTLCGSAQAYLLPEGVVLRTSGLLARSNKVMYDLGTRSVFDTFTGRALSGSLRDSGVVLEETTTVVSTWSEWRTEHPDTKIVAQDGGIGRSYAADPLRGRDDNGPIFPVGPVDSRLAVHAKVIGVITDDGGAVAFPVDAARAALDAGRPVRAKGVRLFAEGGGFRARANGRGVAAHQAFWFAWSQFHPSTALWTMPRS